MAKRRLTEQQRRRVANQQRMRRQRAGSNQPPNIGSTGSEPGPEQAGLVVARLGQQVDIEGEDGLSHRCFIRANIEDIVCGDRVIWRPISDGGGVLVARDPRDNALQRPDSRGQLKTVAANIDLILIVYASKPEAYGNLIDRYLVAAELAGIKPLLICNKIDLLNPTDNPSLIRLNQLYESLGYPVLRTSTLNSTGLEELKHWAQDKTLVLVGQSGVGKSSLVSTLAPDTPIKVGALSEADKGTHTTTAARLFHLSGKTRLIDSPGIREFSLNHLDASQLLEGFIELRALIGQCRFRDCQHRQEPGCAIREALKRKQIQPERFASYQRILQSLDNQR